MVLSADHPYSRESGNPAEAAAKAILESRGNTPRLYRNTLVFLAADKVRFQDLDEALRKYLAWSSVPLWRGDHVAIRQRVDDFARYLYLPRLAGPEVLTQAIQDGVALLTLVHMLAQDRGAKVQDQQLIAAKLLAGPHRLTHRRH